MTRIELTSIIADISNAIAVYLSRGEGAYIPWAYYQFPTDELASTPFLIYFLDGNDDFVADNKNYATIENLVIELYASNVDFGFDEIIENNLQENNIVYSKTFSYIEDEEMYLTRYESEILISYE